MISLFLFLASIGFFYLYVKSRLKHFERLDIPHVKPKFLFGNFDKIGRWHISAILDKVYRECKGRGPVAGMYFYIKPVILVTDPDMLRNVLIKDFEYFSDRGLYSDPKNDPLSAHLFLLEGARWKELRAKLTPTFSSGKMKMMFSIISDVAEEFLRVLEDSSRQEDEIEFKDITSRFTADVIGNCAFGIECNSLRNPKSEFRTITESVIGNSPSQIFRIFFTNTFQGISRCIGLRTIDRKAEKFVLSLVKDTVNYRETHKIERNDFLELLIKIRESEKLGARITDGSTGDAMTFEEMAAQCFVFLLAGLETSSTTMTFCLYELATNPEIQDRLRKEIREVLAAHENQITYEAISKMEYLSQIINETLRLYPPLTNLNRSVIQDYQVPGTDIVLQKGQFVLVPLYSIQRDPDYFPEPEKFDPDRFSAENVKSIPPFTYLPFGSGKRNCIGMRFGLLQIQIGLVHLLLKFRIVPGPKTPKKVEISNISATLAPKGGLWLRLEAL